MAETVVTLGWVPIRGADLPRRLRAGRERLLLMIGRAGCGACRVAHARVPALAAGRVDALLYADADENTALVREYEVFHLPALFLFRDGIFHGVLEAPLTAPQFAEAIEAVLAAPAQDAP